MEDLDGIEHWALLDVGQVVCSCGWSAELDVLRPDVREACAKWDAHVSPFYQSSG